MDHAANTKIITDSEWSDGTVFLLTKWERVCKHRKAAHYSSARNFGWKNKLLSIPTILISTILGSLSFIHPSFMEQSSSRMLSERNLQPEWPACVCNSYLNGALSSESDLCQNAGTTECYPMSGDWSCSGGMFSCINMPERLLSTEAPTPEPIIYDEALNGEADGTANVGVDTLPLVTGTNAILGTLKSPSVNDYYRVLAPGGTTITAMRLTVSGDGTNGVKAAALRFFNAVGQFAGQTGGGLIPSVPANAVSMLIAPSSFSPSASGFTGWAHGQSEFLFALMAASSSGMSDNDYIIEIDCVVSPTPSPTATDAPTNLPPTPLPTATDAPTNLPPTPLPTATDAPTNLPPTPLPTATDAPTNLPPTPSPTATDAPTNLPPTPSPITIPSSSNIPTPIPSNAPTPIPSNQPTTTYSDNRVLSSAPTCDINYENNATMFPYIIGGFNMFIALISALHAFLKYDTLEDRHHQYSRHFSNLQVDLETVLAKPVSQRGSAGTMIERYKTKYAILINNAPDLSETLEKTCSGAEDSVPAAIEMT